MSFVQLYQAEKSGVGWYLAQTIVTFRLWRRAGGPGIKQWIRLLEANAARGTLHPHQVTPRVHNGGEFLLRRAKGELHHVLTSARQYMQDLVACVHAAKRPYIALNICICCMMISCEESTLGDIQFPADMDSNSVVRMSTHRLEKLKQNYYTNKNLLHNGCLIRIACSLMLCRASIKFGF